MGIKIILISGKARHGKDSTAKFIKQRLEAKGNKVLITFFGDLLKYILTKYFNWDGKKDENGRTLLQTIGTDVVRKQKPNYWVDFLVELFTLFEREWDYVIIPDVRFRNECERFIGFDTINIRVERLNFQSPLTPKQQKHPSETELDNYEHFDYIIRAESGLDNLEREVNRFMTWLEKQSALVDS